jgi:hypothetical protein
VNRRLPRGGSPTRLTYSQRAHDGGHSIRSTHCLAAFTAVGYPPLPYATTQLEQERRMESLTAVSALATNDGNMLDDDVALLVAAEGPLTTAAAAMTELETAGAVIALQHAAELVQLAHSCPNADPYVNTPAVAIAAATVLTHAVLSSSHTNAFGSISQRSVERILRQHRVPLYNDDLTTSLLYLDRLQAALEGTPQQWAAASAPGFVTADGDDGVTNNDNRHATYSLWTPIPDMPYERYTPNYHISLENHPPSIATSVVPSPTFAAECCQKIRSILAERQAYLVAPPGTEKLYCACFRDWDHFTSHISYNLVNQALEQFMVREASDCIDSTVLPDEWEERYAPEHCTIPSFCAADHETSMIRVLNHRE